MRHLAHGLQDEAHPIEPQFAWVVASLRQRGRDAQPQGREIGSLYNRSDPALRVFVTEEPDGLFYVWVRRRLAMGRGHWTYAFKTPEKAVRQMSVTAGWSKAKP